MVDLPLDQFFTPGDVATRVVEAANLDAIRSCLDPGCGGGHLLDACATVFPHVQCFGFDKDRVAVAELRRRYPAWQVATADILRPSSARRSPVWQAAVGSDCILVNPPFSMGGTKGIWVHFDRRLIRCSVAMGHLLTTLHIFQPQNGGAAIVPESMMYSELDEAARAAVESKYSLTVVDGLKNCTFRGARANALIVRIRMTRATTRSRKTSVKFHSPVAPEIIRGGLPIFEARTRGANRLPFVHTTDLRSLRESQNTLPALRSVRRINRGVVSGSVLLIPRVGVPELDVTQPIYLSRRVQLSDCVIALRFRSMVAASAFGRAMRRHWDDFSRIYRGTGARYTTMRLVTTWCGIPEPSAFPRIRRADES